MMKAISPHLRTLLLLTTLLLSVSCRDLSSSGEALPDEESTISFRLSTEPETYATGLESLEEEREIRSVSALLFDQAGSFVALYPLTTQSHLTLAVPTAGSYRLLVVVNHTFAKEQLRGKSLSQVGQLMIDAEPSTFVMTSEPIDCRVSPRRTTDLGTIPVTRLTARIELKLPDGVTPTEIKLKGRSASTLLRSSHTSSTLTEWRYDATARRLYTYEESDPLATTLTITASYEGKALKPLTLHLGYLARNVIHRLTLTAEDFGIVKESLTPLNPLSFVALYNIRTDGKWDEEQTIPRTEEYDDAAYEKMIGELTHSFDQARESYASPSKIGSDASLTYHLPTKEEWMSIVPYSAENNNEGPAAMFECNDVNQPSIPFSDLKQTVTVGGETIEATSHFKPLVLDIDGKKSVPACVALRYCGGGSDLERRCCTAWLYYFDYKQGAQKVGFGKTKQRGLYIASITLMDHPEAGVRSVDDLGQKFWDTYLSTSVRRFMPALACQSRGSGSGDLYAGNFGHYWSQTSGQNGSGRPAHFTLYFYEYFAKVKESTSSTVTRCPVRLFADKPIEPDKVPRGD